MNTIDLTPLYRSSIGFDRVGAMLDKALRGEQSFPAEPAYDIEIQGENQYAIRLAVAGFEQSELEILAENNLLTVRGSKADDNTGHQYIYQGISSRAFERKFNLADHIEVTGAQMRNGLLTINLAKEVPEEMKPKSITINAPNQPLEQKSAKTKVA